MARKKPQTQLLQPWRLDLGAIVEDDSSVSFRVWALQAHDVKVKFFNRDIPTTSLKPGPRGYWEEHIASLTAGTTYKYLLNEELERPDPASRFQPEGVHGPSQVINPSSFSWTDHHWKGLALEQYLIYEVHVGTFTEQGTFDAIIPRLPYLKETVGITAIELMPVAQFPGSRNWGYDGTYLFAPQQSYGGPEGLKRLIDACHGEGLAVIMDVVYNHFGPEGNYLADFGPYFTEVYKTPWGRAINYDGPYSDEVRHFIVSNAIYWITEYHIDALRLDAIHGIFDFSATHILQEIGAVVHQQGKNLGRMVHVIAESDLNDSRVITPLNKGGYGLDGQWSDDFHHALHCVLTGENKGYYEDFGSVEQLATAWKDHFVYSGQYSPFRKRRHGNSAKHCSPSQFVVCAQNHDQIGNRAMGDRHSTLLPFDALKVANATVLLCPNLPLLFMGEEYGETAPFLYFIDHSDPDLVEAVRQGRKHEFQAFGWTDVPDPYSFDTFESSRIHPQWETDPQQKAHLQWVQTLIRARKRVPSLGTGRRSDTLRIWPQKKTKSLIIHRNGHKGPEALMILSYHPDSTTLRLKRPDGDWHLFLNSNAPEFGGGQLCQPPAQLTVNTHSPATLELTPFCAWIYLNEKVEPFAE